MKAIISTTYSDTYLYFLPITTFLWNKLGVEVICFMPEPDSDEKNIKLNLCLSSIDWANSKNEIEFFNAPENKQATYAQCSRLYGACLGLPEDEYLVTSDIDMGLFRLPVINMIFHKFSVLGVDLVPKGQYPVCYCGAIVKDWRDTFNINGKTYQECLDNLLGDIDCENMRGNYWGKDQEELWSKISEADVFELPRSNGQNQFAQNRYDRDDSFLLDRLHPYTLDYHMPRPGFEDTAFNQILTVLRYHYPDEDFTWLVDYTNAYKKLL